MTKLTRKEILAQLEGVEKRCESLATDVINARGESAKRLLTVEKLKDKIERAKNCLVASAIGDPMEVCHNTLDILEN